LRWSGELSTDFKRSENRHARIADHGGTAASFFVEIGAAMAA
jgi:hypothetical protein